ncbi:2Fe-2S iron-sulfur cluster binding domain-containing protein [Pedobacter sp. HDW13]|uniref:FAD-binding oxidoreductase n=1 Tax=Pedobacter sp. HDW13 TaxID=2714940 RepID=UPI00140B6D6E|nr:FAD-binding oxidoreductase [Pedobacter sp. HDW13]QIL39201.1 2Fe-2S iron-sulfur cluster binding domain-containing protein [Pedobacter sp. HDW13]
MKTDFYKLIVNDITYETADAVSIEFKIPSALEKEFTYISGQYLTLKVMIDGEEHRRSYSICSSAYHQEHLKVAVKKVKQGKVSTFLNESIQAGDTIEVMVPNGRFYPEMDASNVRDYIFFAGGSGITPIISIIKTLLIIEPKSTIRLFYGNFDEKAIIFRDQIDSLLSAYPSLEVLYLLEQYDQENPGFQEGRLDEEVISLLLVKANKQAQYFVCGPTIMMQNVENVLKLVGIPKQNIHIEYFSMVVKPTASTEEIIEETTPDTKQNSDAKKLVKVILGGVENTIDYGDSKLPILQLAIDNGIDAPYSCREAICCSCRAKVLSGKVKMKNNYALTDEEVEEGYILTCQSIPLSHEVIVSYDA